MPIPGAEVRLRDTEFWTLSDAAGFFRFENVPSGIYTVDASHIAYGGQETTLRLAGEKHYGVDIALTQLPIEIEGIAVRVRSRRWFSDMAGIQFRMARGFGEFITRQDIELRQPTTLAQALQGIAGVRVRRTGVRGSSVVMRGDCVPFVFLDGRRYRLDSSLGFDDVSMFDVELVEIYKGAAGLPAEFHYPGGNRCAVAVWTKR